MLHWFTKHPKSIGETYFQHLKFASLFGFNMIIGGCACLIHAVFPFLFEKTGSNFLFKMMQHFVTRSSNVENRERILAECISEKLEKCNQGKMNDIGN